MRQGTPSERAAFGRQARAKVPRSRHGAWKPGPDRTDPLEILALQATTRLPDLVPIRYGRMAASAFAFFRGAAAVMAADLAAEDQTGLEVQLCGDAHLSNFGGFASPERDLIFDVNDFDETIPGSVRVGPQAPGRQPRDRRPGAASFDEATRCSIVAQGTRSYRTAIREFAGMRDLDIWYSRLDAAAIAYRWGQEAGSQLTHNLERRVAKAQSQGPPGRPGQVDHRGRRPARPS